MLEHPHCAHIYQINVHAEGNTKCFSVTKTTASKKIKNFWPWNWKNCATNPKNNLCGELELENILEEKLKELRKHAKIDQKESAMNLKLYFQFFLGV